MTILHFQDTVGDDASGWANDGQGKLALTPNTSYSPNAPRRSGDAYATDRLLVERIVTYVQAAQPFFSRAMIVEYLLALKTSPLVVLVDAGNQAAIELMRLVAESIVGVESSQIVQITGAAWHAATGQDGYFRSVHERFSALRLQEIVQESAEPTNAGKAYFLCFESLTPTDLALHCAPGGLLASLPTATAVTTVATPAQADALLADTHDLCLVRVRCARLNLNQHFTPLPPPVGLQRIWLQTTARSLAVVCSSAVRRTWSDPDRSAA